MTLSESYEGIVEVDPGLEVVGATWSLPKERVLSPQGNCLECLLYRVCIPGGGPPEADICPRA